tara:strand:- start:1184 stop:1900 length:717 start_codon:yes stop_codon:yes gene_type:complete
MWRITSFYKRQGSLNRASAVESWLPNFFYPATDAMKAVGTCRAIANLPFDTPIEGLPDNFDAVAEFWFDDLDQARDGLINLREIQAGQAWQELSDPASPAPWIGELRPVLDAGPLGIKVIRAGRPAKGVDARDALAYWRDHHASVAKTATQFWALLRRYTQVPAVDPENAEAYPLQADVGAASVEDMKAAFAHPEYFSIVQPDERKFSLAGKLVAERLYFASSRELIALDRLKASEAA